MTPARLPVYRRPRASADLLEAVLWLRIHASPAIAVDLVRVLHGRRDIDAELIE